MVILHLDFRKPVSIRKLRFARVIQHALGTDAGLKDTAEVRRGILMDSLGWMTLLWLALGISSAYRIGASAGS